MPMPRQIWHCRGNRCVGRKTELIWLYIWGKGSMKLIFYERAFILKNIYYTMKNTPNNLKYVVLLILSKYWLLNIKRYTCINKLRQKPTKSSSPQNIQNSWNSESVITNKHIFKKKYYTLIYSSMYV